MQLTASLQQMSLPSARPLRLARPSMLLAQPTTLRPLSSSSSYMGRRMERNKLLGLPQLQLHSRTAAAAQPVRASFFGVGAPEAILVGVVALVVFGPKGLAQAAKSLGSTLRSFAPTIRELTSVSQELKSTLEQEIGLNDIKEEFRRPAVPAPRPPRTEGSSADEAEAGESGAALSDLAGSMQQLDPSKAASVDPDIERKRAESAAAAWGGAAPGAAAAAAAPAPPLAAAPAAPRQPPRAVEAMSMEELEAELARRKAAPPAPSATSSGGAGSNSGSVPQQLSADDA